MFLYATMSTSAMTVKPFHCRISKNSHLSVFLWPGFSMEKHSHVLFSFQLSTCGCTCCLCLKKHLTFLCVNALAMKKCLLLLNIYSTGRYRPFPRISQGSLSWFHSAISNPVKQAGGNLHHCFFWPQSQSLFLKIFVRDEFEIMQSTLFCFFCLME